MKLRRSGGVAIPAMPPLLLSVPFRDIRNSVSPFIGRFGINADKNNSVYSILEITFSEFKRLIHANKGKKKRCQISP